MCTNRLKAQSCALLGLVLTLITSACTSPIEPTQVTSVSAGTPLAGLATPIPFSSPTLTPRLKLTVTSTASPDEEATPEAPTWTPAPTLVPAEREAYLRNLFSTNGNCALPCTIGIEPGKTEEAELLRLLVPAGWNTDRTYGTLTFGQNDYPRAALDYSTSLGKVQTLFIYTGDYLTLYPDWALTMRRYWLPQILTDMEKPSQVLVGLRGAPTAYTLYVFYDHLGLLVVYEGDGKTNKGDIWHVCPNYEQVRSISLYLQAPDSHQSLTELTSGLVAIEPLTAEGDIHTWEEATTLDLDKFLNMFVSEDNLACFDSPQAVWQWQP